MIEMKEDEINQPRIADEMSIGDLEALIEAKRQAIGKGIKQTDEMVLPPGKAPTGFVWVYNRGPKEFEWQHNSIVYEIAGHSFGLFPLATAEHGRRRSLLTVDPVTNFSTHQLALPDDKDYGKPIKVISRYEVIDRRSSADPAQLGRGEKTHVAVISVEGGSEVDMARPGSFSELA